ncbi:TPA_asm: hypothetical protein GGB36_08405 [Listeria monocytogenes]|nr:hypothetical protein [Listeria monocytogenes]
MDEWWLIRIIKYIEIVSKSGHLTTKKEHFFDNCPQVSKSKQHGKLALDTIFDAMFLMVESAINGVFISYN